MGSYISAQTENIQFSVFYLINSTRKDSCGQNVYLVFPPHFHYCPFKTNSCQSSSAVTCASELQMHSFGIPLHLFFPCIKSYIFTLCPLMMIVPLQVIGMNRTVSPKLSWKWKLQNLQKQRSGRGKSLALLLITLTSRRLRIIKDTQRLFGPGQHLLGASNCSFLPKRSWRFCVMQSTAQKRKRTIFWRKPH